MHRTVLLLAAGGWLVGAAVLSIKGIRLLISASEISCLWTAIAAACIGVSAGLVKDRLIMSSSCKRNIARIASLSRPRPWNFFAGRFFIFLALMIATGATLSRLAQGDALFLCLVGGLDLSIGTALALSFRHYPPAVFSR